MYGGEKIIAVYEDIANKIDIMDGVHCTLKYISQIYIYKSNAAYSVRSKLYVVYVVHIIVKSMCYLCRALNYIR